jgi:hypothetical protein
MNFIKRPIALFIALSMLLPCAFAQAPDAAKLLAEQREALKALSKMDGHWRGTAWSIQPDGTKHELTQTERVGNMLDGSIKVVEGRGYEADGKTSFNAFGVIFWNAAKNAFTFRTNAQGRFGEYPFTATADGFAWEIPAGPMTIKYVATLKDGTWKEVGDRVMPGKDPVRFFEMTLKRLGETDWPAAGAVAPK